MYVLRLNIKRELLSLFIFILATNLFNCDFSAVVSRSNTLLGDILDSDFHPAPTESAILFDTPRDFFFDFSFHKSSSNENPDGYGLIYYKENSTLLTSQQQFYMTGEDIHCHNGNDSILVIADSVICDIQNNASLALAHVRTGTGGSGSHPFRFDWEGKTYTYQHNGSINDTQKEKIYNDLGGASWFYDYPSNWVSQDEYDDVSKFIDSEIVFHWIMKNIIENQGNVINGFYDATTIIVY